MMRKNAGLKATKDSLKFNRAVIMTRPTKIMPCDEENIVA